MEHKPAAGSRRRPQPRPLTCAHGAAIFASLNNAFPSHGTLLQFAAETGLKMASRPSGPWQAVLDTAAGS